jgi:hypothetical protein
MTDHDDVQVVAAFLHTGLVHLSRALGRIGGGPDVATAPGGSALLTLFARGPLSVERVAAVEAKPASLVEESLRGLALSDLVREQADGTWQVTDAGREVIERGREARIAFIAEGLAKMPAEDVALLGRAANLIDRIAAERHR